MAAWRAQGREIPRVGVNVHPTVLQQTELPARVAELLRLHGLPGASLEVEIIESALQTGLDTFVCLEQLAKLGVTLALDDFGVGFSSLSSIKHLPLHRIKIDREFVRDLHISGRSRAIAATVLALAQNLGMEAIAEGVEEQAQVESLLEMGCHHFQGYFYARPMSAAQLVQWQSSTTLAS
jgi:EAL domain-containing protein (putative c-di-GMP-specific phosphodiesterase class I)